MSEPKWTPGPWKLDRDRAWIFIVPAGRGATIATLPVEGNGEANGRLIAAAPRLMAALRQLHDITLSYFGVDDPQQIEAIEEAIAALADAGDRDALNAQEEWQREQTRLGIVNGGLA
jgi:hypothetical protein